MTAAGSAAPSGADRAAAARQTARRWLRRIALRPGRVAAAESRREELVIHYLRGDGIEIGALIHPLWVPPGVKVRYVDNLGGDDLLQAAGEVYTNLDGAVKVDVVDDGTELAKFADASVDFVIANHVLEHLEDPVRALRNWVRVLRSGGVLFISLPDPGHSFDSMRQRTTVEHVLRDHNEGPAVSHREHLAEYARVVDGVPEERVDARIEELESGAWSIHFHVWELQSFLELLFALKLPARVEAAQAVAPEFTVVLRKQ
jgi:SAM-dependent methyltransferase